MLLKLVCIFRFEHNKKKLIVWGFSDDSHLSFYRGGKTQKNVKEKTKKMKIGKFVKDAKAVSPVIATLMLVLVSVGSAGVFYVWQADWQEGTTDDIDTEEIKSTLQIGGSSTVYPVTVDAAEKFMDEFPQYKIEVKKGGSDSGIIGAGENILDIGAASKNPGSDDFETYPDMVVTTIGYDGVVLITRHTDIQILNATQLKTIYGLNGGLDGATDPLNMDGENGGTVDDLIQWNEVETYPGSGVYCSGGTIQVYDRSEKSGTEECFCKKLMDGDFDSQITMSATNAHSVMSNQELIDEIASDSNALGFMAYGIAKNDDSVEMIQYAPYTEGDTSLITTNDYNTENNSGIPNFGDIGSGVYKGSRPLNYITDGEPTGLEAKFIQYVLWTENNYAFLNGNDYVSIFD